MVPHQMGNVPQTGVAVTMRMVMVMCVLMVVIMGMFMVMIVAVLVLVVVLMAVVMLVIVVMCVAMIVIMFVTVLMELCALAPAAGHIVAFLFLAVHTDAQMHAGNSAFEQRAPAPARTPGIPSALNSRKNPSGSGSSSSSAAASISPAAPIPQSRYSVFIPQRSFFHPYG